MYNKVAKTLVAFEYLWYQAWVQSIDQAKAGLQVSILSRFCSILLSFICHIFLLSLIFFWTDAFLAGRYGE
jgi:hypothetical protein